MYGVMIDIGPEFYSAPISSPGCDVQVKVTDLEILY